MDSFLMFSFFTVTVASFDGNNDCQFKQNNKSGFSQTHNIGNNANIGIRGFTMWKKSRYKMLPPVGIEPGPLITSDSKSNTILSTLIWHVLLRKSLNFCSCTTLYLDFHDLREINRAWLYKEPKVSVLQANVKLV